MEDFTFNADDYEPDGGFDVLPAGWYTVIIDETEFKPTRSGHGTLLKLRYSILEGQYKNQKIFDQLNVINPNKEAQHIARKQLSAICHAVHEKNVSRSTIQLLHGKPLKVRVKVKKTEQYGEQNEVNGYKEIEGAASSQQQQPPPQQPAQQQQPPPAQQPPAQQPAPPPAQAQQPWEQPPVNEAVNQGQPPAQTEEQLTPPAQAQQPPAQPEEQPKPPWEPN